MIQKRQEGLDVFGVALKEKHILWFGIGTEHQPLFPTLSSKLVLKDYVNKQSSNE